MAPPVAAADAARASKQRAMDLIQTCPPHSDYDKRQTESCPFAPVQAIMISYPRCAIKPRRKPKWSQGEVNVNGNRLVVNRGSPGTLGPARGLDGCIYDARFSPRQSPVRCLAIAHEDRLRTSLGLIRLGGIWSRQIRHPTTRVVAGRAVGFLLLILMLSMT